MEQIQLEEAEKNHPLLTAGEMDSVVVHRKSRLWEFTLHFSKILPIMLYRSLAQHLTVAFKEIAQVKLNILADDQTFDEQLLQCDTPLAQQVLKTQVPVIKDRKVILPIDSTGAISYLKQQYLPLVEELFVSYGFPKFRIEPEVDEQQAERVLKLFE